MRAQLADPLDELAEKLAEFLFALDAEQFVREFVFVGFAENGAAFFGPFQIAGLELVRPVFEFRGIVFVFQLGAIDVLHDKLLQ